MKWKYKDGYISDNPPPNDVFGFVYILELKDGRLYIGKKNFWETPKLKPLSNGKNREGGEFFYVMEKLTPEELKQRTPQQKRNNVRNKKVKYERIRRETKWRDYLGSSKQIKPSDVVDKRILYIAQTKRHLTYLEAKALFVYDVLNDDRYVNDNVLGKFYRGNLL